MIGKATGERVLHELKIKQQLCLILVNKGSYTYQLYNTFQSAHSYFTVSDRTTNVQSNGIWKIFAINAWSLGQLQYNVQS